MTWEPRFDPSTHAHTSDPDTSHESAKQAIGLAARHQHTIWTILLFHGPLTSQEISDKCELSYMQVVRRMKDLCEADKVEDSGIRRDNPSGRPAAVWRIT